MASAELARTSLTQRKHWVLVKDLISSYKGPQTQKAKLIKKRMECIFINFREEMCFLISVLQVLTSKNYYVKISMKKACLR